MIYRENLDDRVARREGEAAALHGPRTALCRLLRAVSRPIPEDVQKARLARKIANAERGTRARAKEAADLAFVRGALDPQALIRPIRRRVNYAQALQGTLQVEPLVTPDPLDLSADVQTFQNAIVQGLMVPASALEEGVTGSMRTAEQALRVQEAFRQAILREFIGRSSVLHHGFGQRLPEYNRPMDYQSPFRRAIYVEPLQGGALPSYERDPDVASIVTTPDEPEDPPSSRWEREVL
jgi:hypothetical protein